MIKISTLGKVFTIIALLAFVAVGAQTVITSWDFEPSIISGTSPAPGSGTGTASLVIGPGGSITPDTSGFLGIGLASTGCGTASTGNAWQLTDFTAGTNTDATGARFSVSTVGYTNIIVSFDLRWSNTSPNTARVQYTLNGTTWTNMTLSAANTTICGGTFNNGRFETDMGDRFRRLRIDFSAIAGACNNPNFGIRILAAHYQATGQFRQANSPLSLAGNTGTWRFDNVQFLGTAFSPMTASISATGPTAFCSGGSTTIRVTIAGGSSPYTLVYSNGSTNTTINNYTSGTDIVVNPTSTTTYTITSVTSACGQTSSNSGSAVITVYPLPAVPTSSNQSISCSTAGYTLTASPAGGTFYTSPGGVPITNPYTGPSTNFVYTVTNANGCPRTSAVYTFTRTAPATVITQPSTASEAVCGGASFTLPALVIAADSYATGYQWYWDNNTIAGGETLIAGATSSSYAPVANFTGTRYYKCRVFSASCGAIWSAYSGAYTVSTVTWNGTSWVGGTPDSSTDVIFAGNYSSTGDLNACSVRVNSGSVVFNANHTINVQNGVTVAGGSLTFQDDSSLVQVNNTANSGSITYKRDTTPVRRYDYTYWSSPVDAQILANLSPLTLSDKYYWWNTNPATYNWSSIIAPGITPMEIGKGYIIRAPQNFDINIPAVFTGVFTGVPNNGDVSVPIVVSGAGALNLIGNPYPCAVNADKFLDSSGPNGGIVDGTIYFWTHNTPINPLQYTQSDYAIYNIFGGVGTAAGGGTGNTNIPDQYIAAGQAFFVNGINSGGTAHFLNSMREVGSVGVNDNFYRVSNRSQELEKHRIWLEIKNSGGAYKQTLFGYAANATDGKDRDFDGGAFDGVNVIGLYSMLGDEPLGIQACALPFDQNDTFTLGYRSNIASIFEINLSQFDGLFLDHDIFIEDKLLNVIHNLKESSYVFSSAVGTFNDRFLIRFAGAPLGTGIPQWDTDGIVAFYHDSLLTVHTGTFEMKDVKLFDLAGRMIFRQKDIQSSEVSMPIGLSHGILIVTVEFDNGSIVSQKIGF